MKTVVVEKLARIIKNKQNLEKALNVKITNRGKEVTIDGTAEDEFMAEQTITALNFGFPYSDTMLIKSEGFLLEILNIKEYTKKNDLKSVRARIIGKGGKALKTLSDLTNSAIELKNNKVGVIADPEELKRTTEAIIAIIKGAKHGAVYKELENTQLKPIGDLGLKDSMKNFK